ncbi:MAG: hypothetical protein G01um101466_129 [Parcubacteria group bacterium Gr01-1014_66]|nr:MAG: hypothetical protein G01um101466_129 [Parcubacteria group bacterium Gr01-1014_66]
MTLNYETARIVILGLDPGIQACHSSRESGFPPEFTLDHDRGRE